MKTISETDFILSTILWYLEYRRENWRLAKYGNSETDNAIMGVTLNELRLPFEEKFGEAGDFNKAVKDLVKDLRLIMVLRWREKAQGEHGAYETFKVLVQLCHTFPPENSEGKIVRFYHPEHIPRQVNSVVQLKIRARQIAQEIATT